MSVSRRTILGALGASGIGLGVSRASFAQDRALENSVVIRDAGGVFAAALKSTFYDPFEKATGVKVVPVTTSYGEMISKTAAMAQSGRVEWDIISPQFYELKKLSPYLADLGDCSSLPNVQKLGVSDICGRYGVQYLLGGVLLAFNASEFRDKKPSSWADFWNVKDFPGQRSLPSYGNPWNNTLLFALLADGVEPSKLFPLDLDRAFRKLDQIRPNIAVWWKTGTQSQDLIRSGEVSMLPMWSGVAVASKRAGMPVDWTLNQMIADRGSFAILRNGPHPNAARAFIDFYMTNPENHVRFAHEMGYLTTNAESRKLLSPQERSELVPNDELVQIDGDWVENNSRSTLERWNNWIAS